MTHELLAAARNGDAAAIEALLAAPELQPDSHCFSALYRAEEHGEVEAVRLMLEHFPALPYWQYGDLTGRAVEHGHIGVLQAFLNNPRLTPQQKAALFADTRRRAVRARRDDIVEQLTAMRFPVDQMTLTSAIHAQNVSAVESLLADPRCIVPNDVLDQAAQTGNPDLVRAVLRDPRSGLWLRAALWNLESRDFAVASIILNDPRILEVDFLLNRLANRGRNDLIALLLPDERLQPNSLEDALRSAVAGGSAQTVRMLLADRRSSPTSAKGREAMALAVDLGHTEVVAAFLEDKRVTNEPDHATIKAALIKAARADRESLLRRLLAIPGVTFSPSQALIAQLVPAGRIRVIWRLLRADERFVVGPLPLQAAVVGRHMLTLRLFLRDPRVRDVGHVAIQEAVSLKNSEAFVRLLVSWDDPAERAAAVEAARAEANEPLRSFIDDVARRSNGWFNCMNALSALTRNVDMNVLFQLADEADRQGLDGATLRRLHAQGWLEPAIDKVFGSELSESFGEIFKSNYALLSQFSQVSASLELSPHPLDDVMPEVIRRMTTDLTERATDVLWRRVYNNRIRTLAGTSENGTLSSEQAARKEQEGMIADLSTDCISELKARALDLPREHAPRREVPYSTTLKFRARYLWKMKDELGLKERDEHAPVRESARELSQALERFTTAVESRDADALALARRPFHETLASLEQALSLSGQTVDARSLAAIQEFSQMSKEKLFDPQAAVLLSPPRRELNLEI
ncbi:MAG TPA: hypothetical protein VFE17_03705 [Candidatus Baltobacteraceae bacterium]|nr:hypothetical protein [Candidatus Baltobacteraceae bacterium]